MGLAIGPRVPNFRFDVCPICQEETELTAEHVPPEIVGGNVLTGTCRQCNHNLGSRIDRPFSDSMFGLFSETRLSVERDIGVPGLRRMRGVRIAETDDGRPAVFVDYDRNRHIVETWNGAREFEISMRQHSRDAINLGELKSLYLSCCTLTQTILSGPTADQTRAALVATRKSEKGIDQTGTDVLALWRRHITPFDADGTAAREPVRVALVRHGSAVVPAISWLNYVAEMPYPDAPEMISIFANWPLTWPGT